MKYCNRCGAVQVISNDAVANERSDKRLDNYLDGLFWITAIGVAVTVGGMVTLKKLQFSDGFIVAFMILSASAFLVNLALNLRVIISLLKPAKAPMTVAESPASSTSELEEAKIPNALHPAPSVTENTTRSFEPVRNKTLEGWAERYRMKDE
jgi:hypothetical protein